MVRNNHVTTDELLSVRWRASKSLKKLGSVNVTCNDANIKESNNNKCVIVSFACIAVNTLEKMRIPSISGFST